MKRGTPDHPKMRRLARWLVDTLAIDRGVAELAAPGLMERLWHFTAQYAPTGDLTAVDPIDLAEGTRWPGKTAALIEGLVACGWLDRAGDRLLVHGWSEHADNAVRKKLAAQRLTFADGQPLRRLRTEDPDDPNDDEPEANRTVADAEPGAAATVTVGAGVPPLRTPGEESHDQVTTRSRPSRDKPPPSREKEASRRHMPSRAVPCRARNQEPGTVPFLAVPAAGATAGNGGVPVEPDGEEAGLADRVAEIRERLHDRSSDDWNLRLIVSRIPWPDVERAVFEAWGRFRDGQTPNPTAYFVGIMKRVARESGIELGLRDVS